MQQESRVITVNNEVLLSPHPTSLHIRDLRCRLHHSLVEQSTNNQGTPQVNQINKETDRMDMYYSWNDRHSYLQSNELPTNDNLEISCTSTVSDLGQGSM